MFNFQVACAKKFQPKNEFFCSEYGMTLEKMIRSKYRCAIPKNPVFFISRCFKNA